VGKLEGAIALVTGGSSGIGLATARSFMEEGATVIITGRRQSALDSAVDMLGGSAIGIRSDISLLGDIDRVFEVINDRYGRLNILFANAGVGEFVPIEAVTEEHFDKTFGVNAKGTFFTVQKALPLMSDGSSIILNGSIAASKGFPSFSVYGASKAAIRSYARTWIVELRGRGIRVNVISPGTVPTPGYDTLGLSVEDMEGFIASQNAAIPLGRVGRTDEIAKAVLFLASGDSSYVNGVEFFVDGGLAQI
jgi:NAD(P)-dependent dehydrogenase (short-subunit alcohol dehydrogenase family)